MTFSNTYKLAIKLYKIPRTKKIWYNYAKKSDALKKRTFQVEYPDWSGWISKATLSANRQILEIRTSFERKKENILTYTLINNRRLNENVNSIYRKCICFSRHHSHSILYQFIDSFCVNTKTKREISTETAYMTRMQNRGRSLKVFRDFPMFHATPLNDRTLAYLLQPSRTLLARNGKVHCIAYRAFVPTT